MYEGVDWKPTNKNKNLMEIETATCAWCFKTASKNAIRTSQNEKETILEEIKEHFQDLKGHFQDPKGHFVTWYHFLGKSYTKCAGETTPRYSSKISKLSIFLDQQCKVLNSLFLLYAYLRAIEI